jgi:hypothetical protein
LATALERRRDISSRQYRFALIGNTHIDNAIHYLSCNGANVGWLDRTKTTAFDHCRAGHADICILCCNDHVATSKQCCVARKAITRRNTNKRRQARQLRERCERHHVQPRDAWRISIAWSASPAFGKQHNRQTIALCDLEEPVFLSMVDETLRARQHGVVVCDYCTLRIL